MLYAAISAQLLDALTTWIHVVNGGEEGNPLAFWFMSMFGVPGGLCILKALAMPFLILPGTRMPLAVWGIVGAASWLV
jgi:hypothetical protein